MKLAVICITLFLIISLSKSEPEQPQCTKEEDRDTLCKKECNESDECRCITPPDVRCIKAPCLFATCIAKPE